MCIKIDLNRDSLLINITDIKNAPKLDKIAKDNQWERLYMVGEGDSTKELEKLINRPIDAVFRRICLTVDKQKC